VAAYCERAQAAGVVELALTEHLFRFVQADQLLAGYPFDVLLGSVHWVGGWRFDDLDDALSMAEWSARDVDACWDAYAEAFAELASTRTCDVLAHPDLVKVSARRPEHPQEWWERLADAAAQSGMAAEVSSAGWRKPAGEQYPAEGLLARLAARGVPFTTASDAHHLSHVADRVAELSELLRATGVDRLTGFRRRQAHTLLLPDPASPDPASPDPASPRRPT
ncbi:MAG: hypothetical protein ACRDXC_01115, partial [Acidimicrobiales bacterium]